MTNPGFFDHDFEPSQLAERNLVVLVLDHSGSMASVRGGQTKIDQLNEAIDGFLSTGIAELPPIYQSGELAACAFFGRSVRWLSFSDADGNRLLPVAEGSPFHYARYCASIERLRPDGGTPMADGLQAGIEAIEERKRQLDALGIVREFRPNIFLVTDGHPSSDVSAIARRIVDDERQKKFILWALGTHEANAEVLRLLAGNGTYTLANGKPLSYFPAFMSSSLGIQGATGLGGDTQDADSAEAIKQEVREELENDADFEQVVRNAP